MMNRSRFKRIAFLLLIALFVILFQSQRAMAYPVERGRVGKNGPLNRPLQVTAPVQVGLPSVQAGVGQVINMDLAINTVSATRGIQFGVTFNPAVLRCESVTQGAFYSTWAAAHNSSAITFPTAVCDNVNGKTTDMGIILLGSDPGGPSGSGVVATVRFTVLSAAYTPVSLINVQVSDDSALSQPLPVVTTDGAVNLSATSTSTPTITNTPTVTTTPTITTTSTVTSTLTATTTGSANATKTPTFTAWPTKAPPQFCANADVNRDGFVNVLDLTSVGSMLGQRGTPGWIPQDVFPDGVINVQDLTAVGSCWMGATTVTLTPTPTVYSMPTLATTHTNTPTATSTPTITRTVTPTSTVTATATFITGASSVKISAPAQAIAPGSSFTVTIDLDLNVASRGGQAGLTFNPAILRCDSVEEGDFYKTWAAANGATSQVFPAPQINNTTGTISSASVLLLGGSGGPTGKGSLFIFHFTALAVGTSSLQITDTLISDSNIASPHTIPVNLTNGTVNVAGVVNPTGTPTLTLTPTITPTNNPLNTSTPSPTVTPTLSTQAQLSVISPAQNPLIGQTITISIQLEVVSSARSRGAQVAIQFNPAVLHCDQFTEGPFYKTWAQANNSTTQVFPVPAINNTLGTVSQSSVIILGEAAGGANGTDSLFDLRCTTLAAGVSTIHLTNTEVADDNQNQAGGLTLTTLDGQVTVNNQSLPSSTATQTMTRTRTLTPVRTPSRTPTATVPYQPQSTSTRTLTPVAGATNLGSLVIPTAKITAIPTIASNAHMSVNPAQKLLTAAGQTFSLDISIESDKPVRSAQVALKFNPAVISCESATEGGFFKDWATKNGGSTFQYPLPTFNASAGTMSDTSILITGAVVGSQAAAGGPTQKGTFLTINCTSKGQGVSEVTLQNVLLSSEDTASIKPLAVALDHGQVFVGVTPTPGGTAGGGSGTPTTGLAGAASTSGPGTSYPQASGSATVIPTSGIQVDSNVKQVVANVQTDSSGKIGPAVADIEKQVASDGMVTEDIQVASPDNLAAIRITKGVQALTSDNHILKSISFALANPVPEAGKDQIMLSAPYEVGPEGATFDPQATIVLAYDKALLQKDIDEKGLFIAWYDKSKNAWIALPGKADPNSGTVSAQISHFSIYAVFGKPNTINWMAIIIASLVIEALLAMGLIVWRRRRKMLDESEPQVFLLSPPFQEFPEIVISDATIAEEPPVDPDPENSL